MINIPEQFKTKIYNAYLTLAIAEEFDIPINIWFDYDSENKKEIFMHSFINIPGYTNFDVFGSFDKISERFYENDFNFVNIEKLSVKEARERINATGIKVTDIDLKKKFRNWFRKHWLVINVRRNGLLDENWVFFGFGKNNKTILFITLYETRTLSKYIHQVNISHFQKLIKKNIGFIKRRQHSEATINTILSRM
jgi:hypothetical protein